MAEVADTATAFVGSACAERNLLAKLRRSGTELQLGDIFIVVRVNLRRKKSGAAKAKVQSFSGARPCSSCCAALRLHPQLTEIWCSTSGKELSLEVAGSPQTLESDYEPGRHQRSPAVPPLRVASCGAPIPAGCWC